MKNAPEKQSSPVRRITIDERLADGLIRILIANLKANIKTFGDDPDYWWKERDVLVHPKDYQEKMGIPPKFAQDWPWDKLYEGQVFLSGGYREITEKGAEPTFVVDAEQRNFQCIDRQSKDRVKRSYLTALERRI